MANTVRDIMHSGCTCVGESETVLDAAKKLAAENIGVLPICGEDDRLKGMITDRDIVVKVLAQGRDPANTNASDLGQGTPVWISADAPVDEALATMKENKIRRLPVIDDGRLVGMLSQGDLATHIDETQTGELVETISAAP